VVMTRGSFKERSSPLVRDAYCSCPVAAHPGAAAGTLCSTCPGINITFCMHVSGLEYFGGYCGQVSFGHSVFSGLVPMVPVWPS